MFKFKVIAFVVLTAVFISSAAYCQQVMNDRNIKTISGKVVKVGVEAGLISIQTKDSVMTFYIGPEAVLYWSTSQHMTSVEIKLDDPVIIQYVIAYGKNTIINLVDNKPNNW
ncbi:MAG: hypothetical protein HQL12_00400 [Candidatus Omnitrophica bacterium]|nr:hypothetical protein [Candidatus Omnitrophota bacterium]